MFKVFVVFLLGSTWGAVTWGAVIVPPEINVPALSNAKLCWTGSGIRKKKVFIAKVSVYRLDSYVACDLVNSPQLTPSVVLNSPKKALKLTFLRDVPAEKVQSSFRESLNANSISVEEGAPAAKLLAGIQNELKEGQEVWLTGSSEKGQESLVIKLPTGELKAQSPTIATDFWKIWFGLSKEAEIDKLRAELLSKSYDAG